ncbi:ribokinase [bacterium]|nr:ribokinase [bacterium]
MDRKPVVVIGSSNMDLVIKSGRIPRPGETILGGEFAMIAGGKGANQAVAAARLGAQVYFVARVGKDAFGAKMLENFTRDGIRTDYVVQDESAASGVAIIVVDRHGENIIVVAAGANAKLCPADIDAAEAVIAKADSVLLQLEIPLETVERAVEIAGRHGTRVILDPAPARELPDKLLAGVSLITPNETEAELLTGISGADEPSCTAQAEALKARGVATVLVTRGKQGVLCRDSAGVRSFPTVPVQSVDSTAAGDCFNGALGAALARGESLEKAIAFACRAAALSTTRLGAQDSLPTVKELT